MRLKARIPVTENWNRQRSVYPSGQALLKALYLATFEATKKWTQPLLNWGQTYGEMCIMYEGRLPYKLKCNKRTSCGDFTPKHFLGRLFRRETTVSK